MKNKSTKLAILIPVVFLAVFVLYVGYRKIEKNRMQAETVLAEMQGKLDNQKDLIDTQQSKMDELQGFKEEQKQANEQASEQDKQNKKADCEARLKKAQDSLASSQRYLGEDQAVLKEAEAGKCQDCYKPCIKSYGDDDISEKTKDQCKKNDADNLKNRKSDVAGDVESVKKGETTLQNIENECKQYLN